MKRISREEMAMEIAHTVAKRGTCGRLNVGCVIMRDSRIITTGYNGSPSGMPHCIDIGCEITPSGGCDTTLHAEIAAITFAAKEGIPLKGTTMYSTDAPCYSCAKAIVNAGISSVVFERAYRDSRGIDLLQTAGVLTGAYSPNMGNILWYTGKVRLDDVQEV